MIIIMAITNSKIKDILAINAPKGIWLTVSQIQDIVSSNYSLQEDDMAPHTETRETNYPVWKHRIQGALSELVRTEIAEHRSADASYKF